MPNLIATPRAWKKKSIFMKVETLYGTDAVPTGVDWMEARNLNVTPIDPKMVDRNIMIDGKGRVGQLMAAANSKISFDVALAPAGTAGTKPKWDAVMLAAGWASTTVATTSVTYNLVSIAEKSATIWFFQDGTKQVLVGVRGSWKLSMDASGLPMMSFEGQGLYAQPTAAPALVPDKTDWTIEEPVGALRTTGTFNGVSVAFSKYEVDQANTVNYINLPGPQEEVVIADRAPSASFTILAPTLTILNPYQLITDATLVTAVVNHGSAAGKRATVTIKSRVTGVSEVEIEGYLGYQISMQPEASSVGDDEIVLALT
jgi:hypothetical protein